MQSHHARHPPLWLLQIADLDVFARPVWASDRRATCCPNLILSHGSIKVSYYQLSIGDDFCGDHFTHGVQDSYP
jgi:hypothetical protein